MVLGLSLLARLIWHREGNPARDVLHGFKGWTRETFGRMKVLDYGLSIDLEMVVRSTSFTRGVPNSRPLSYLVATATHILKSGRRARIYWPIFGLSYAAMTEPTMPLPFQDPPGRGYLSCLLSLVKESGQNRKQMKGVLKYLQLFFTVALLTFLPSRGGGFFSQRASFLLCAQEQLTTCCP